MNSTEWLASVNQVFLEERNARWTTDIRQLKLPHFGLQHEEWFRLTLVTSFELKSNNPQPAAFVCRGYSLEPSRIQKPGHVPPSVIESVRPQVQAMHDKRKYPKKKDTKIKDDGKAKSKKKKKEKTK